MDFFYTALMILGNYHTHCNFCDGQGPPEAYVTAAMEKGFSALGFSSHAPLPVDNQWAMQLQDREKYLAEMDRLKSAYSSRIQIYKALEIDYIPGFQTPGDPGYDSWELDYRIGSVHSTGSLDKNPHYHCIDGPLEGLQWLLERIHGGSFRALCEEYYTRAAAMVDQGGFSILGHLDLVKKHNQKGRFFSEEARWYQKLIPPVLEMLSQKDVILELNSGGIARGAIGEIYPSPWILAEAKKRGIRVMLNSDAHRPGDIDFYFREMRTILQDTGYGEVSVFLDGNWTTRSLEEISSSLT